MQTDPNKRRRRAFIVGGTVGVLGAVAAVSIYFSVQADEQPVPPAAQPPANSTPASPGASPSPGASFDGRGPNGCAGGPTINADMVLTAQQEADSSTDGAVEVAAAFNRWIARTPLPSAEEAATIEAEVLAADAFTDDLAAYLAAGPNLTGVEGGEVHFSTTNGVWQIESSTPDSATVSIGSRVVVNGAVDSQRANSATIDLVREDDLWKVVRGDLRVDLNVLFENGIEFDGGC